MTIETSIIGIWGGLIGFEVRLAWYVIRNELDQAFEDLQLRLPLFSALAIIEANPGISQGEIGRTLQVKRTNMVPLMNELVSLGFVDRTRSAADGRAFELVVTEQGSKMIAQAWERVRDIESRLFEGFTQAELEHFPGALKKIASRHAEFGEQRATPVRAPRGAARARD
jgi:DNA-binding MarR family transcriptional regulator